MTPRRLLILGALAIVALVASLLLSNQRSASHQEMAALYPQLKAQINSVNAVRIFKAGDTRAVELLHKGADWIVSERYGYPADAAKVRKLLLSLAQAKPVEEKTSNPQNYAALGVEDVSSATATGVRVELDGIDKPVNLIVGKSGSSAQSAYVRRAGEPASWLINQNLDASAKPHDWLHTAILDVAADRIQSATIAISGAKSYSASKKSRADADFAVDAVPKGKQLDSPSAANGIASALAGLTLADVLPLKDFEADKPAAHSTFKTFDGLVTDVDGWMKDSKHYIALKTAYDDALAQRFHVETKAPESKGTEGKAPEQPKDAPAQQKTDATASAESKTAAPEKNEPEKIEGAAKAANARLSGWVYEIPEYKYEAIFKPMDGLLKKK